MPNLLARRGAALAAAALLALPQSGLARPAKKPRPVPVRAEDPRESPRYGEREDAMRFADVAREVTSGDQE